MKEQRPWLKFYDHDVPWHLDIPDLSVIDLFCQSAQRFHNHFFLICGDQKYTYAQSREVIQKTASFLQKLGVKPGDRVGLSLPNIPEFVFGFYGILAAGGVVVAINPAYKEGELDFHIRTAEIKYLIGLTSNQPLLEKFVKTKQVKQLILVRNVQTEAVNSPNDNELAVTFFEKIYSQEVMPSSRMKISADEAAVFQFSGGTTGTPKPAVATHHNLVTNISQFRAWLSNLRDGEEVFMAAIPLYHVYGMVIALNVAMMMGATIVLVPDARDINGLLNTIQRYSVSFFPAVPTIFHAINQNPDVVNGKIDLRSIKACISGSAPLLKEIREKFESFTGGKLVEGYGLSEAPTATHCNPILGENREGSIGLPLPDVDCRIIQLEPPYNDVEPGEEGELLIRSPQVMQGYYMQPEETAIALTDGWLHTGDIARMDKDGYFFISGRSKELIKVNGLQVWPREVEEILQKMPGVKEAAVAGLPDVEKGEKIKAWVVLRPDTRLSENDIIAFCRDEISHYKVPDEVEFLNELPRTAVGKLLRRELVGREMKKTAGG